MHREVVTFLSCAGLVAATLMAGCATPSRDAPLEAEIRWTEYGVPHVEAADYASLGYGYGYAAARDQFCLIADHLITLRGERSKYHGRDGDATVGFLPTTNINSDLFYKVQLSDRLVTKGAGGMAGSSRELARGYAAGINRYAAALPADGAASRCGLSSMPEFGETDIIRAAMAVGIIWKAFHVAPFGEASSLGGIGDERQSSAAPRETWPPGVGSNVWAYGGDVVSGGSAIVVANPHTQWGSHWLRLHQVHLTIPGELDVAGAAFVALPFPVIGFNNDLAWSIQAPSTVTYFVLQKMTVYVDAEKPVYVVDGEERPLSIKPVPVEVADEDGAVRTEVFELGFTGNGPIYRLPEAPGRSAGWYAVTDAGEGSAGAFDQFMGMARAGSVREARDAISANRGLGAHIVAGDRRGDVLYIESGPMLDASDRQLQKCRADGASAFNVLDGERSECSFRTAAGEPALAPDDSFPTVLSRKIIHNANNSYRYSAYGDVLEQRSLLFDDLETEWADLRFSMSQKRMGEVSADGEVTVPEARAVVLDNRNYAAETWLDQILTVCASAASDGTMRACKTLDDWDRRNDRASRGALLFRELWARVYSDPAVRPAYDAARPVERGPLTLDEAGRGIVSKALEEAVAAVEEAGQRIDAPWGDILKFAGGSGPDVPLHGGGPGEGVLNALNGTGLSSGGFARITAGTAYLQVVHWVDGEVQAEVLLAHGQSIDPESPHYYDQIGLFSDQALKSFPFTESAIDAVLIEAETVTGSRTIPD